MLSLVHVKQSQPWPCFVLDGVSKRSMANYSACVKISADHDSTQQAAIEKAAWSRGKHVDAAARSYVGAMPRTN